MIRAFLLVLILSCITSPYNRGEYKHWSDFDKNGFDTRAEILIERSLCEPQIKKRKVITGCWVDAYTGEMYYIAKKLHIDHVVALKEAHLAGASLFSSIQKENFANDKKNLVITNSKTNVQKSAHPPHKWYPPRPDRREWYRSLRLQIMKKYKLRPSIEEVEVYLDEVSK